MINMPQVRAVREDETRFPYTVEGGPRVVEAVGDGSDDALADFLGERADWVEAQLRERGALVLRGFDVSRPASFDKVMGRLPFFRPTREYFMREMGRDAIKGTGGVLSTNAFYPTGGTWFLSTFHSENFYTADVPHFLAFWCKSAPWLGGESALVHMRPVFEALRPALQARLRSQPVVASLIPLCAIAQVYGGDIEEVAECLTKAGYARTDRGTPYDSIVVKKPLVFRDQQSGKDVLSGNLSGEVPPLDAALNKRLASYYKEPCWALHRAAWRRGPLLGALMMMKMIPTYLSPKFLASLVEKRRMEPKSLPGVEVPPRRGPRLADLLEPEDIEELAAVMADHVSAVTWRRGDILLFDNTQVLHSGLAGFGPREIQVMMGSVLPLPPSGEPPFIIPQTHSSPSLHEKLQEHMRSKSLSSSSAEPSSVSY